MHYCTLKAITTATTVTSTKANIELPSDANRISLSLFDKKTNGDTV